MTAVDVPQGIPPLVWLVAVAFPAMCTAVSAIVVALITRPVKRAARAAEANSAAAAQNAAHAATSAAHAATELTPNHGSSTKDQTTRMETKLDDLATGLAAVQATADATSKDVAAVQATASATSKDVGGMREELRTERRERLQLAERFDEHVRTAGF